ARRARRAATIRSAVRCAIRRRGRSWSSASSAREPPGRRRRRRGIPMGYDRGLPQTPEALMRIDFVSDVACPWCALGFPALARALERIGEGLGEVEVHLQPFELNPHMGPEGADLVEYLTGKYGM